MYVQVYIVGFIISIVESLCDVWILLVHLILHWHDINLSLVPLWVPGR